jgi:hypothetical protein
MVFLRSLLILCAMLFAVPAQAGAVVSFYSHEFGKHFPHAFITIEGRLDRGGEALNANYGFTAKSVTSALFMGNVAGEIEVLSAKYVTNSDRQFSLAISDSQYDALIAAITKWRDAPGKSYNLNSRNCVHFAGELARTLGLKVFNDPSLSKKPRKFLVSIKALNPGLK